MRKNYNTRQREFLIEFFKNNPNGCYAIEDIMRIAKDADFNIGLTTVYRNLEMLEKEGFLARYNTANSCVLFRYAKSCAEEHYHLYCTACREIIHLDCNHIEMMAKHIKQEYGFNVSGRETVFYGKCAKCVK